MHHDFASDAAVEITKRRIVSQEGLCGRTSCVDPNRLGETEATPKTTQMIIYLKQFLKFPHFQNVKSKYTAYCLQVEIPEKRTVV